MKNKVFKYIKVFISVALILSLVAPSYASLSASDGSAFVTKAEFDSALADFNSRLTSFEAGINSKIDSQVTSYLDRNGIWNGSQQDILRTEYVRGIPLTNADTSISTYIKYMVTNSGATSAPFLEVKTSSASGYYPIRSGQLWSFCLVEKIKKTGLMMIDFELMRETDSTPNNITSNPEISNIAKYLSFDESYRRQRSLSSAEFIPTSGGNKFNYLVATAYPGGGSATNAIAAGRSENFGIYDMNTEEVMLNDTLEDDFIVSGYSKKWSYNILNIESAGYITTNEKINWYTNGNTYQFNALFFVGKGERIWMNTEWNKYGRFPDGFMTTSTSHQQNYLVRVNSVVVY